LEVKRAHAVLSDEEVEDIHKRLKEFLLAEGLKSTPERFAVLDEIYTTDFHFEAEDILLRMIKKNHKVSRATIYRTLDILEKCGLIRKAKLGETTAYYEHTYGRHHHEHMKCTSCGKIIEFESDDIERMQDVVCNQHNFKMTYHILHIFGVCEDCQKKGTSVPAYTNPYV